MHKIICLLLLMIMPAGVAMADTITDSLKSAWGYSDFETTNGAPGEFSILGGTGANDSGRGPIECSYVRGNQTAAYGTIGVVARQVVEHGGYFCPTQVQCDSRADKGADKVYFAWYNPASSSAPDYQEYDDSQTMSMTEKCRWLCDDGYSGTECKEKLFSSCDENDMSTALKNVKMRRNHDRKPKEGIAQVNCHTIGKIDSQIPYFGTSDNPAKGVVLGVIKFLDHGVIAAPIKLTCATRKNRQAWLDGISLASGKSRVLCAAGYKPDGENCVKINDKLCEGLSFCSGFSFDKYNDAEHIIDTGATDCVKYFCSDDKKSFTSATDFKCVDCVKDIRDGVDKNTGLCTRCTGTGQYFDSYESKCKPANEYMKPNLKYGKNASEAKGETIDKQCWTMGGTDYIKCVTGKANGSGTPEKVGQPDLKP